MVSIWFDCYVTMEEIQEFAESEKLTPWVIDYFTPLAEWLVDYLRNCPDWWFLPPVSPDVPPVNIVAGGEFEYEEGRFTDLNEALERFRSVPIVFSATVRIVGPPRWIF